MNMAIRAALGAATLAAVSDATPAANKKPNFVVLFVDVSPDPPAPPPPCGAAGVTTTNYPMVPIAYRNIGKKGIIWSKSTHWPRPRAPSPSR